MRARKREVELEEHLSLPRPFSGCLEGVWRVWSEGGASRRPDSKGTGGAFVISEAFWRVWSEGGASRRRLEGQKMRGFRQKKEEGVSEGSGDSLSLPTGTQVA